MPNLSDIARHVQGLIELASGRSDGLSRFDLSIAGFWRSFALFFLCAPFYLLFIAVQRRIGAEQGFSMPDSAVADVIVSLLGNGAGWVAFPAAMVFLARVAGLSASYVPLIIVYNWSAVPITVMQTIPILLYGLGLADLAGASLISLMILPLLLWYLWRVTRTVIAAPKTGQGTAPPKTSPDGLAAGIVGFHLFLSLCVELLTSVVRQGW